MALVLTTPAEGELLSVTDAKRHLRILSSDLDDEVASLIAPLSDDWLADKFKLCDLLELVVALRVLTDLVETI